MPVRFRVLDPFFPRVLFLMQRSIRNSGEANQQYADDRIVVKLKAGAETITDLDTIAEEIVRVPGARAEAIASRRAGAARLIHLNRGVSVEEAIQRANEDPRVEYAEPDYFVYAMDTVPNDPFFNQMWGLWDGGCLQLRS